MDSSSSQQVVNDAMSRGVPAAPPQAPAINVPASFSSPTPLDVPQFGITELYKPPPDVSIVADLIFVHGLMGHPRKTWQWAKVPDLQVTGDHKQGKDKGKSMFSLLKRKGKQKENETDHRLSETSSANCYWPLDLLPLDIPNVRVLTYGYDTYPTHFYKGGTTRMTITQHCEDLLHRVGQARYDCIGRPLIFLAHSLGGILVKGALNESQHMEHQPMYADLRKSCFAVIFFGTPHLGAGVAVWGERLSNIVGALPGGFTTYSGVLKGLAPDSETLYNISRRFNELLNEPIAPSKKIQICSVQEGRGMGNVKGLGGKIIRPSSTVPILSRAFSIQNENHMDMCKFSSANTQAYKDTLGVLRGYLLSITNTHNSIDKQLQVQAQDDIKAFLKEIDFESRCDREHQLSKLVTDDQSLSWIWSSTFVAWLKSSEKLFWIVGHPASGKSTLINYVAKHDTLDQLLEAKHGNSAIVIKFFFDYRGAKGIKNNFEGLRRSLLHQLLQFHAGTVRDIERRFHISQRDTHEWLGNDDLITDILEYVLDSLTGPILLFIDGLDEYQGQRPELLTLIDQLGRRNIRICLSSRDEEPFTRAFTPLPFVLRMDTVNRVGIEAYAQINLRRCLRPRNDREVHILRDVAKEVAVKSSGVFLWARFAVLEIIEEVSYGQQLDKTIIEKKLAELPKDLEMIYERIFRAKKPKDKLACGVVLRLITSARRPIQVAELYEASCHAKILAFPMEDEVQQNDLARFEQYVKTLGAGTIEVISSHVFEKRELRGYRSAQVKVIHRSVQTYLDHAGWLELLDSDNAVQVKDMMWFDVGVMFLKSRNRQFDWIRTQAENPSGRYGFVDSEVVPDMSSSNHHSGQYYFLFPEMKSNNEFSRDESSGPSLGGTKLSTLESYTDAGEFQALPLLPINLSHYIHKFLPNHACLIEQETKKSFWQRIEPVFTNDFVCKHMNAAEYGDQEDCIQTNMYEVRFHVKLSGLHLAIAHGMYLSTMDAVGQLQDRSNPMPKSLLSTLEIFTPTGFLREKREKNSPDGISPTGLLETAVFCSCNHPSVQRSAIVQMLAKLSAPLNDDDMLFAIRTAPVDDVRALLSVLPPGQLFFSSRYIFRDPWLAMHRYWRNLLSSPQEFGPLWEVGCRRNDRDVNSLLDIFFARGESINSRCGPLGTILHSAVAYFLSKHLYSSLRVGGGSAYISVIKTLIARGANINISGQHGAVLEYCWQQVHLRAASSSPIAPENIINTVQLMRLLIENGATNMQPDPNGLIPTIERMLDLENLWKDRKELLRYHSYGPRSETAASNTTNNENI